MEVAEMEMVVGGMIGAGGGSVYLDCGPKKTNTTSVTTTINRTAPNGDTTSKTYQRTETNSSGFSCKGGIKLDLQIGIANVAARFITKSGTAIAPRFTAPKSPA